MTRCAKKRDLHVFHYAIPGVDPDDDVSDELAREAFPPGLMCQCGAFTWGQMNERERQFDTLESMWAASL